MLGGKVSAGHPTTSIHGSPINNFLSRYHQNLVSSVLGQLRTISLALNNINILFFFSLFFYAESLIFHCIFPTFIWCTVVFLSLATHFSLILVGRIINGYGPGQYVSKYSNHHIQSMENWNWCRKLKKNSQSKSTKSDNDPSKKSPDSPTFWFSYIFVRWDSLVIGWS